jgi:hypothetical protein
MQHIFNKYPAPAQNGAEYGFRAALGLRERLGYG